MCISTSLYYIMQKVINKLYQVLFKHMKENLDVLDFLLSDAEMGVIKDLPALGRLVVLFSL